MRIALAVLLGLLAGLPPRLSAQPSEAPARLTLSFEGTAVVASGLRSGGQVVWFGVARELDDGWATIVRREEVASDTDGDGVVRLELDREVPLQSVWVAVDLTNGK